MSRYYRQLVERFGYTWSSDAVGSISTGLTLPEVSDGKGGYMWVTTATSPGSGQLKPPAGCTSVSIECWGGGGAGGSVVKDGAFPNGAAGGAGGSYAFAEFEITEGQTIYYYVGLKGTGSTASSTNGKRINGTQSWINLVSNTKPTSLSQGILAVGGQGGQSRHTDAILPGIGTTAGCIGEVVFAGGNGATGSNTQSGGGGGMAFHSADGQNANGTIGGFSYSYTGYGSGAAGRTISGNGNVGISPGGGGSGALLKDGLSGSYLGGNGGGGQIKFYWGTHLYPIVR